MDSGIEVKELSRKQAAAVVESTAVSNLRYVKEQFAKHFKYENSLHWLCLYDNSVPKAMCVLEFSYPVDSYVFINEIQSFEPGKHYGKLLLEHVFAKHKYAWLMADITQADTLLGFYRSLGLKECTVYAECWKKTAHMFTANCSLDVISEEVRRGTAGEGDSSR